MAERVWRIGEEFPRTLCAGEEELLAAGAPVGFHWIADRQSGPLILRFGTEEQRRDIAGDHAGEIG